MSSSDLGSGCPRANDGFVVVVHDDHGSSNSHSHGNSSKTIYPARAPHRCSCSCHPYSLHQERRLSTPCKFALSLDCKQWIEDFEEIARANNWQRQTWMDILPVFLEGLSTKTWFRENRPAWQHHHRQLESDLEQQQQQQQQQQQDDFEAFKQAFLIRFGRDESGQLANTEVREEHQKNLLNLQA
ncbi:hypothetical protein DFQ27_005537 [Actinomortierella ambigua]|uniref:Uncharacterized protein n=1 Tax=Actinomortierella ambigua TaxID=1343610 RepID=A0A9P6U2S0_9FUNG|nr:hypothetical protein DFQ27_005537 [Actinomortierella ambigua]